MNICFILKGYEDFNISEIYDHNNPNFTTIKNKAQQQGKYIPNAFNVYITKNLANGNGVTNFEGDQIAIRHSHFVQGTRGNVLAHELAHDFYLYHPWGPANGTTYTAEHVTRYPNDPNYNALSTADMVHDTPAMVSFYNEGLLFGVGIEDILDLNTCEYKGSLTDNLGVPFNLTPTDVGNVMAYTWRPCIVGFTVGQGIRIREYIADPANANKLSLKAMVDNVAVDLYIRDSVEDFGEEPNIVSEHMWDSPDIWVRHQQDYIYENQNPKYHPTQPNYIHVRIRNRGCDTSTGNEQLKLYWSKAATAMNWDHHWNGATFTNNALVGQQIGTFNIPVMESGEEIVLALPWTNIPNPNNYVNINNEPWHFCLLARIEATNDPMRVPETSDLAQNVRNNNNIAQKNITVVNFNPNNPFSPIGEVVAVRNLKNSPHKYSLVFSEINKDSNFPLLNEAEISLTLDNTLMNAWIKGGKKLTGIRQGKNNSFIILNDQAKLEDLFFNSQEVGTLDLKFNFLTKEVSNNPNFKFQIMQKDALTNEAIGGENYEISKYSRNAFYAQIETITSPSNQILLKANDIGEPAFYNWYDSSDNLIYQGKDLTVTDEITKKYKLEIVALSDGYKDYDETETAGTNPNKITEIYPNPATDQLTISYELTSEESAYISINSLYLINNVSNNYIIENFTTQKTIDISGYPQGFYAVTLIVGGEIIEIKKIIKN